MDFTDFNAMVHEAAEGVLRFLKFYCEMAGIVIDPQMWGQPFVMGMLVVARVRGPDAACGRF